MPKTDPNHSNPSEWHEVPETDLPRGTDARCRPENTFMPFPDRDLDISVATRFERQAVSFHDKTAVVSEESRITYGALNRAANRIAHALLTKSGNTVETIALFVDHGAPMIAAMLGVLKAGKIYVPLDLSYPPESITHILSDSQAKWILTDTKSRPTAQTYAAQKAHIINIDDYREIAAPSPECHTTPDSLAYILYTSGSTGTPKGVMQNHRNLLHLVKLYTNDIHLSSDDRLSFVYSHCFAAGVKDVYGALLNGATVCSWNVKDKGVVKLPEWLIDEKITVYHSVPTVFRHMVKEISMPPENFSLRLVSLGSEPITSRDLERFKRHFPDSCLFHIELGATETGVIRQYFADKQTAFPAGRIPLGYPVTDKTVILSNAHESENHDLTGEITVQSRYLSPGYWNQPELTQNKFQTIDKENGLRVYHTGDLGRIRPDGCLEFLGRKDFEVKIRGERIDTNEVDFLLGEFTEIEEAVTLPYEDQQGNTGLIAFCTPSVWPGPPVEALQQKAAEKLTGAMRPTRFVTLRFLPQTPNGKVDRLTLQHAIYDWLDEYDDIVLPDTAVEQVLVHFFAELLSLSDEKISTSHDFFQLGGNSLSAAQLRYRIHEAFDTDLPITEIFNAPTVAGLAGSLFKNNAFGDACEKKARQLIQNGYTISRQPHEPPVSRSQRINSPIDLTTFQHSLWFLQQLHPDNPFYNWSSLFKLSGPLDPAAVKQSFTIVIERHTALRTVFQTIDGHPSQIILETIDLPFEYKDLREQPSDVRQNVAMTEIANIARMTFDLTNGPLLRITLMRMTDNEHLLLVTLHHIICDGWSMEILFREFSTFYQAIITGSMTRSAPSPTQYADISLAKNGHPRQIDYEQQLAYWTERLHNLANMDLPKDYPRPAVERFRGSHHSFSFSEELTSAIETFSKREGKTVFMMLLAAFQLLLHRYTGQTDIAVGVPVAIRNSTSLAEVFGMLVNLVVMRTDFSNALTFSELLRQVKKTTLDAYANQDIPFENIVERLRPERTLSHNPLFQVTFEFENFDEPIPQIDGIQAESVRVHNDTAKFDLTLNMANVGRTLTGYFEYNRDLFNAATIERMARHFEQLLTQILVEPDRNIAALNILPNAELKHVLETVNTTTVSYTTNCIHDRFSKQAIKTPHHIAMYFKEQQLTYAQLNHRANQLAHYLKRMAIGPDVPVGIYLERSMEMIIALLGVLKAGGAYVPLDPAYPKNRIEFMMADAEIPLVLTRSPLHSRLPQTTARIICLDAAQADISKESGDNPPSRVHAGHLAYIIYTSGSTGKPKGVAIEHRNTAALLSWAAGVFSPQELSGVVASTSICFDLSVFEMFVPLTTGGSVLLVKNILELPSLSTDAHVTLINTVPSAITELLKIGGIPATTLTVNLAGEPLMPALVDQIYERTRVKKVYDLYGPSEDTTYSTFILRRKNAPPSIGRPIDNTRAYILDAHFQPLPFGLPGELFLGGAGVARGYLNRPELTSERFKTVRFVNGTEERLYRTGDLVKYQPDGSLELIGRMDHQVKIRGFRIELGEIESMLKSHPNVREALVMARDTAHSSKELTAYIIVDNFISEEEGAFISQLRQYVREFLPEYMVPTAIIALEAYPLTPNGKVDRNALPAPDRTRTHTKTVYSAPITDTEQKISTVWKEIIGIDTIGRDDNFFDIGGHSLQLPQVHARLCTLFDKEITIIQLFKYPTIHALGDYFSVENDTDDEPIFNAKIEQRAQLKKQALRRSRSPRRRVR